MPTNDEGVSVDPDQQFLEGRISRRRAMKAALGGAAAAAVFSAPRIEGFSVAPDYASAQTCFPKSNGSNDWTNNTSNSGLQYCIGNVSGGNCQNKSLPTINGPRGLTINGNLNGSINNSVSNNFSEPQTNSFNFNISGLNAGSCTLFLTGNCSFGNRIGAGTYNYTTNGNRSINVSCNSVPTSGSLSLRVNCTC